MKKIHFLLLLVMACCILLSVSNVPVAYSGPMLKMVSIEAKSPGQVKKLARMGIDIAAVRKGPVVKDEQGIPMQTYRVEAVVSARDEKQLSRERFSWSDLPGEELLSGGFIVEAVVSSRMLKKLQGKGYEITEIP